MTSDGTPQVVISMVLYNHAGELPGAMDSLLSQTFTDFRLLLIDDCSSDGTRQIAEAYARKDARVTYLPNKTRKGMIGNWRHALATAQRLCPETPYFAWASDHDAWEPRWLELSVEKLNQSPDIVLAYPMRIRMSEAGEIQRQNPWTFDTVGIANRSERLHLAVRNMSAGSMMYGLFRLNVLRPDMLHHVFLPDRLFISELAIYGQFSQIYEHLYIRRSAGQVTLNRQLAGMFPRATRTPTYLRFPWWVVHTAVLSRELIIRGSGQPAVARSSGAMLSVQYLMSTLQFLIDRKRKNVTRYVQRTWRQAMRQHFAK